jgi:hypothetical protein
MTPIVKRMLIVLLALLVAAPVAFSQAQENYSQADLDRMLAPVALYPDPLLSQILMASTYPVEVEEAAQWSRANPGLTGDDAVRAAEPMDWDPSVKSLVAFPQVLQRMAENMEWTRTLGDAFLAQQPHVMDTVQQLRRRAHAAGNLQSTEQVHVQRQGPTIMIVPASPQYVYVPYYDPLVVYGPWWWPGYGPVAWAPWPGYAQPSVSVGFWWGAPAVISAGFFFGNVDWRARHVRVVHVNNYYVRPATAVNRTTVLNRTTVVATPGAWRHDPGHRRGVAYRDAKVRQRFAAADTERREPRFQKPPARDLQNSQVLTPQRQPREAPRDKPRVERRAPQAQPQELRGREQREHRQEQREQRRVERKGNGNNGKGRGDRS